MKAIFKTKCFGLLFLTISFLSCKETMEPKPVRKGETPNSVSQYTLKSVPGGAIITYNVPEGSDVRYIKAVYELNNGTIREAKSSIYDNKLLVDGFAQEGEYDIKLYAVGVGEVESAPTPIKIKALRPNHQLVVDGIRSNHKMYATFGGINVDYENEMEANLVIRVLTKNTINEWEIVQTAYTKSKTGRMRIRGYEPTEREFAVYVTDRWNNKSDTLINLLTPVFEVEFQKSLYKQFNLPGDTYTPHTGASRARAMPVLWDGLHNKDGLIFHTRPADVIPQHFTWDMGVKAKLSRFIFYPDVTATNGNVFGIGQPSVWELWGSNSPNPDGNFDTWTLVGTFTSIKPSGLPVGQFNNDDLNLCLNGEEFEVDPNAQSYRYWRWRTLSNWGNVNYIYMSEFSFYGTPE